MQYQLTADDYELLRVLFPNDEAEAKVSRDSEALQHCFKLVAHDVVGMMTSKDYIIITKLEPSDEYPFGTNDYIHHYEVVNTQWEENEDDEFPYPKLYRNKGNDCVVLAINPTCGTIVKEAANAELDTFVLPIGTFQTCFIPFHIDDEWEIIDKVEIKL